MENDEVIRLALKITEENNTICKLAAKNQSFMITAVDGNGTEDRFFTVSSEKNANEWKNQFNTVGFTNVTVKPWRMSGNLAFGDVDATFFTEITNRPKIGYTPSPTKLNPFGGTDVDHFATDARRFTANHTWSNDNCLQKHLANKMPNDRARVRAGWFDGNLINWVVKTVSNDTSLTSELDKQYPDLYSTRDLIKHLVEEKIDASTFYPTEHEIDYFGIDMYPLITWFHEPYLRSKIIPYKSMFDALDKVFESAMKHKFNTQYNTPEMTEFLDRDKAEIAKKQDETAGWLNLLLRSKAG